MAAPLDLAQLLAEAAAECPDRIALVEAEGRSLTWAQLDDEVSRVATGLGAAGIVAGHRVVLVCGNRIEFVTTYLGVLRAQAVAVPLNPRSTPDELARVVVDCGARVVVVDGGSVTEVRGGRAAARRRRRRAAAAARGGRRDDAAARRAVLRPTCGRCRRDRCPRCSTPDKLAALLYNQRYVGPARAPRCSPTGR